MNNNILKFIHGIPRNKIVFLDKPISNLRFLDVGKELSVELDALTNDSRIAMKSIGIIDKLFSSSMEEDAIYGKYLALNNIGILFESELKIDFVQLLDKYSSSNILFVQWEGEKDNQYLYFLTKEKGRKINIENLSHITIWNIVI